MKLFLPLYQKPQTRMFHHSTYRYKEKKKEKQVRNGNETLTYGEQLKRAYRLGFENAGKNWNEFEKEHRDEINKCFGQRYAEADFKAAIRAATHEIQRKVDRYVGRASMHIFQAGYETGCKEGEEICRKKQAREMMREMIDKISKAKEEAFDEGLNSRPDVQAAKRKGKEEAEREFEEREQNTDTQKKALYIEEYKKTRTFSARAANLLFYIQELKETPNFFTGSIFLMSGGLLVLVIGGILVIASLVKKGYHTRYDMYLHGETSEQYVTRQNTINRCRKLKTISPQTYGLSSFHSEEEKDIKTYQKQCELATTFYQQMRDEMAARRGSGYGNQKRYGPRDVTGVHVDHLKPPYTQSIYDNQLDNKLHEFFKRLQRQANEMRESEKVETLKKKHDHILEDIKNRRNGN